jgi:hypothetical protein
MQYCLELPSVWFAPEHSTSESISSQATLTVEILSTEYSANLVEDRLSRFGQLAGDGVGIDDTRAQALQDSTGGSLPHPDSPG